MACGGVIPSGSHERTVERVLGLLGDKDYSNARILDLGAGAGYLSWKLYEWLERGGVEHGDVITACDLYPALFKYDKVECVKADLTERLPFDDGSFDLVLAMGVIEHVPDQVHLMAEIGRLVRFGGRGIVTTPNVLNVGSRLRYLLQGLPSQFDILPVTGHDARETPGRIGPISLYYLYYFARLAGFAEVRFHIDDGPRSAAVLAAPFYALARLADLVDGRRRRGLDHWQENLSGVSEINSWKTFIGRTLIMEALRSTG